jgi:hypothetical protein
LGITVDDALSWKNHINVLSKKLSRAGYVIRNMKQHMSTSVLQAIYYSFSLALVLWTHILGKLIPQSCDFSSSEEGN